MKHWVPGSRSRGFSLVELMVGLTISLVLFAGAISIFLTSRTTYADTDRLAQLQDAGRVSLDFLVRDVRAAGLTACLRRAFLPIDPNRPPTWDNVAFVNKVDGTGTVKAMLWDFRRSLVAYDGAGGTWTAGGNAPVLLEGQLQGGIVPNPGNDFAPDSDILIVRGPTRDGGYLRTSALSSPSSTVPFAIEPPPAGLEARAGDVMLITDCEFAGVFQVQSASPPTQITHLPGGVGGVTGSAAGTPGNADDPANPWPVFRAGALLIPLRSAVYFVAPSAADPSTGSLWRRVTNPAGPSPFEELIEGVESMQVMVAIADQADGQASRYVNPTAVTRWEDVVGVQIALLVRTPDEDGTAVDRRTYTLLDAPAVGPFNDRRQRAVFATTATMRNWAR